MPLSSPFLPAVPDASSPTHRSELHSARQAFGGRHVLMRETTTSLQEWTKVGHNLDATPGAKPMQARARALAHTAAQSEAGLTLSPLHETSWLPQRPLYSVPEALTIPSSIQWWPPISPGWAPLSANLLNTASDSSHARPSPACSSHWASCLTAHVSSHSGGVD